MKSRGAGLVIQMELINFLKEHDIATEEAISLPAYKRQYISQDGSIQWEEQTPADDFMGQRLQTAKECFTE